MFQVKNKEIDVIDAFLSSSLLTLSTFDSLNLHHINVPFLCNTDGFLTFSVVIELAHWREKGCFIYFNATCHVSAFSFSPNCKG